MWPVVTLSKSNFGGICMENNVCKLPLLFLRCRLHFPSGVTFLTSGQQNQSLNIFTLNITEKDLFQVKWLSWTVMDVDGEITGWYEQTICIKNCFSNRPFSCSREGGFLLTGAKRCVYYDACYWINSWPISLQFIFCWPITEIFDRKCLHNDNHFVFFLCF